MKSVKTEDTGPFLDDVSTPLAAITSEKPLDNRLWRRRGVVGWWLNLTAPPSPPQGAPVSMQERVRKAELTSVSILLVFLLLLALVSNSLVNIATAEAVGILGSGLIVAGFLNRNGWTRTAAYLVPSMFMLALIGALVGEGNIRAIVFPLYDLFALAIIISGFIADRRAPWILLVISLAITFVSYFYAPHQLISVGGAINFDEIGYELKIFGWWGLINRDVALLFFAAFFSWLGARSVEKALARADRADEIAALQKAARQRAKQLADAISAFVDEIVAVFAAFRNGKQAYLRARHHHDPFSPHVHFLNKYLEDNVQLHAEQQRLKQGELARATQSLVTLIEQIRQGWVPVRALGPDQLPAEAQPLRALAASYYALMGEVTRQAVEQAKKGGSGMLPQHPDAAPGE